MLVPFFIVERFSKIKAEYGYTLTLADLPAVGQSFCSRLGHPLDINILWAIISNGRLPCGAKNFISLKCREIAPVVRPDQYPGLHFPSVNCRTDRLPAVIIVSPLQGVDLERELRLGGKKESSRLISLFFL